MKERLGHASISTTEKYLHTLPNADETALEALDKIRSETQEDDKVKEVADELEAANAENARLRAVITEMAIAQHSDDKPKLHAV